MKRGERVRKRRPGGGSRSRRYAAGRRRRKHGRRWRTNPFDFDRGKPIKRVDERDVLLCSRDALGGRKTQAEHARVAVRRHGRVDEFNGSPYSRSIRARVVQISRLKTALRTTTTRARAINAVIVDTNKPNNKSSTRGLFGMFTNAYTR